MPQRDYRAYAQTPRGKAARARAHARYVAKRREARQQQAAPVNFRPLLAAFHIGQP